jgi:hypothetical protein
MGGPASADAEKAKRRRIRDEVAWSQIEVWPLAAYPVLGGRP